jgi:uncharacterized protein (TIGR02266 family)
MLPPAAPVPEQYEDISFVRRRPVDERARSMDEARRKSAADERRASVRLPIEVDVDVEGAAQRFRAVSLDLSVGGMFVGTRELIPIGTQVMLSFKLPNGTELQVLGTVQWRKTENGAGLGVAFFCLDPEVRASLERFCAVREPLYSVVGED